MPVFLHAVFNGPGGGQLVVHNTTFFSNLHGHVRENAKGILSISTFGPRVKNLVVIQNVLICKSTPSRSMEALFYSEYYDKEYNYVNVMTNVTIFYHYGQEHYSETVQIHLMKFIRANVVLTGTNSFNSSGKGATIKAVKSKITFNETVTIVNDYLYESNCIVLESNSVLNLKEPLNATFYNKGASRGSAIQCTCQSSINILSNKVFT